MALDTVLYPTYETGGKTKFLEGVSAAPDRVITPADVADFAGGQLNPPFIADFLSMALAHEQCGRHLYNAVSAQTANPILQRRYQEFGRETTEHIGILQELITTLGGDPGYVSPSARATEKLDAGAVEATFVLDGSIDIMTKELLMLDAVLLAETVDHGNWELIEELGEKLEGPAQEAVQAACAKVRPQEDDHVKWAHQMRKRMVMMQATRPLTAGVAAAGEELMTWFKGLFAD
jgi:rubrerythrin